MPTAMIATQQTEIPLVDIKAQYESIKREIDAAMQGVVSRCGFIGGEAVDSFERNFAAYCQAPHAVGVSSGTNALHLVLAALGIGPGDEVILPSYAFISTAEPVAQTGARLVFADIEPAAYTIDPGSVARRITARTRAIICTHTFGQMADMGALRQIVASARHDIAIIEDAAHAPGAAQGDCPVGAASRAACFSFFPERNLGAYGDAGAIVTRDAELAGRCRKLAAHGRNGVQQHEFIGYSYRLDALQAAVLDVKLRHLDTWTEQRRNRAALFDHALADVPGVTLPQATCCNHHVYHRYVIQVDERDALRRYLAEHDIATGVHYGEALHRQPALIRHGFDADALPVTEEVSRRNLSLPMYPELSDQQIRRIANAVMDFQIRRVR